MLTPENAGARSLHQRLLRGQPSDSCFPPCAAGSRVYPALLQHLRTTHRALRRQGLSAGLNDPRLAHRCRRWRSAAAGAAVRNAIDVVGSQASSLRRASLGRAQGRPRNALCFVCGQGETALPREAAGLSTWADARDCWLRLRSEAASRGCPVEEAYMTLYRLQEWPPPVQVPARRCDGRWRGPRDAEKPYLRP
jgi:hypothetical protein